MQPIPLEMEVWYLSRGVRYQGNALLWPQIFWERQEDSPVQLARHVVLFKFTWQASWDRGARWRWVSLDLRDLLMLSHNRGYHLLCPLHRWSAGLSPVDSVPLVWTQWRVRPGGAKVWSVRHGSSSFSNLNAKSHNKCSCTELEILVVKALCPGVECSLYVDDFLIYYRSKHIHIIERHSDASISFRIGPTPTDINSLPQKKVCIHFCRLHELHPDPQLFLNGSPIPVVEKVQFRGIIFWQKTFFFSAPMLS